jgi:cysteine desulfurase
LIIRSGIVPQNRRARKRFSEAGGGKEPNDVWDRQFCVAQVSKPAVSPTSKSAPCIVASGFGNPRHSRLGSLRSVKHILASRQNLLFLRLAIWDKGLEQWKICLKTIYFDYNATTPLDPKVLEAMMPFFGPVYGNPSNVHHLGRKARSFLDEARERVAGVWKAKPSEVVFTSGGTESNNLAIFGTARLLRDKGRHLITSTIEHHAVLHSFEYLRKKEGFSVTYLPVNSEGLISPDDLNRALRPDTILVSLMAANNETGTLEPVAALGEICRSRGVLFHTDAVQWFGKEHFERMDQFNADLVSVCAHKFHGPKGAGALFIKSPLHPDPILFGGSHENERRAGTENLAGIIGLAEACERFLEEPVFPRDKLLGLTNDLISSIHKIEGVQLRGSLLHRLSNTVSLTVSGAESISLLAGLDMEGICASSGSACSAGSLEPSHVMLALGVEKSLANSLIRFSLGRDSTDEEVKKTADVFATVVKRVQNR